MSESPQHFSGNPPTEFRSQTPFRNESGEAALREHACSYSGFPQCERVRVFVFLYYHSCFAFKQQQRKQNIGLCGCQFHVCQNLMFAGLNLPDGGGAVCGFVSFAY